MPIGGADGEYETLPPTEQERIDRAVWQARMEERMDAGDKRFKEIGSAVEEVRGLVSETREELTEIKTKVGLYGAVGGLAGSLVVGLILFIGSHGGVG